MDGRVGSSGTRFSRGGLFIFSMGATRETENIVEGRAKRLNSILHNINCISL